MQFVHGRLNKNRRRPRSRISAAARRRWSIEPLEERRLLDSTVVFNEILFNPAGTDESLEWIELHNQMGVDMDLSGWRLDDGVEFDFPDGTTIDGGGYLVVAADPVALEAATGLTGAMGPYTGRLSNGGESIDLVNNSERWMDSVQYDDRFPWPVAPDGSGASLAKRDADTASESPENWTHSEQVGGTPGADNFVLPEEVPPVTTTLIAPYDEWAYDDSGTDLGTTWRDPGFDEAGFNTDVAPFGTGDPGDDASLVGYWNFDDNVLDQSGTGNDGTLASSPPIVSGSPTYDANVPGAIGVGKSLNFDDPTEHVLIDADDTLDSNVFTLSMFINDRGQSSGVSRLTSRAGNTFETGVDFLLGHHSLTFYPPWDNTGHIPPNSPATPPENWEHVAFVYDGATMTVYVDGAVIFGPVARTITPSGTMRIGNSHGNSEGFNGLIDDVAIWNVTLPQGAIQMLSDGNSTPPTVHADAGTGAPADSLVGYWNFDDTVLDQSGTGNDGTLSGVNIPQSYPTYDADIPLETGSGKSLNFDSDVEHVFIEADPTLNSSVFTLSMFVNDRGQSGVYERLTSRGDDSFETALGNGVSYYPPWTSAPYTPSAGTWEHIAYVADGGTMEVYADGNLVHGPVPFTGSPSGFMHVGNRHNGVEGFDGLIDDVALWNVPLSQDAIGQLADGSATPLTVSTVSEEGTVTRVITVRSNVTAWRRSETVVADDGGAADWNISGPLVLPASDTYTILPSATVAGQSVPHIHDAAAPLGVEGLLSGNDVNFFRTTFELDPWDEISATMQLAVDNGAQVFVNGQLIATETSFSTENWATPLPSVSIAATGSVTSNKFDSTTANFSGWLVGENELVVAVRNPGVAIEVPPPGGFGMLLNVTTISPAFNTELDPGATTYYFRNHFDFDGDPQRTTLTLTPSIDDGAVFYLNGTEVYRQNMPDDPIDYTTPATEEVEGIPSGVPVLIPAAALIDGPNVLAVELHHATGSADALFDTKLKATVAPPDPEAIEALALNEIGPASELWLELANTGETTVDLAGYVVASSSETAVPYALPGGTLNPGEYLTIDAAQLSFDAASGDRIYLYDPTQTTVLDGALVEDRLRGRSAQHDGRWLYPDASTPGTANTFALNTDVVINEIMYHPRDIPATPDTPATYDTTTLIAWKNDLWRYNESGELPTNWPTIPQTVGGNWQEGEGLLGFEVDSLPQTIGTPLTNPQLNDPFVTTYYFEREFTLSQAQYDDFADGLAELQLNHLIDDGALFYVNGVEAHIGGGVYRDDMPPGPIDAATFSNGSGDAVLVGPVTISADDLLVGTNRISVEVHQANTGSTDVVFGLELLSSVQLTPFIPGDPGQESDRQWIELFNTSTTDATDLTGWRFSDGIDFQFSPGTSIGPGEYLIIAKDAAALAADHPGIDIAGIFSGRLSHAGERIELLDAAENPADGVEYFDDGRWHGAADGGGASLELRDPDADNGLPEAWAASDEIDRGVWQTITYRGPAVNTVGNTLYNELVLGLLDAGVVLIDDVSVIEDPDGTAVQLIQNGSFDADLPGSPAGDWRIVGNHDTSRIVVDPDDPANRVLRLVATGATEHMSNHAETTLKNGDTFPTINAGLDYEISLKARWVSGSNQLNSRLYFNRLTRTTLLEVPGDGGTPALPNTAAVSNIGPTYEQLGHSPVVPEAGQNATVSVRADDPDGMHATAPMTLYYAINGGAFTAQPMAHAGDGLYAGSIPGQSARTVVQFYVEGRDALGAVSTFPAAGPDSRALLKFDDAATTSANAHDFRIIMTITDADRLHDLTNVMSNARIGATVVYNESEVFYDVGVRLKGSEHGRAKVERASFNVGFDPMHLFRGVHETVAIDRSGAGNQYSQKQILVTHTLASAGDVPAMYDDLIHLIAPRDAHTGSAVLQMARYSDVYLDSQFDNGGDGTLFEYEIVYAMGATVGDDPEGLKLTQDGMTNGVGINASRGTDKEQYRWNFIIKNNRGIDDYSRMIEGLAALGQGAGPTFHEQTADILDVDQWLRSFAVQTLWGIGDNYVTGSTHNAIFYVRPEDDKVLLFPWDVDFVGSAPATSELAQNGELNKLLTLPANRHTYYGHVHDIVATTFNGAYMGPWVAHYDSFLPAESLAGFAGYVDTRSSHALEAINTAIPPVAFAITTPGGGSVHDSAVTLEGDGWVDVREIERLVDGTPENGTWETLQVQWPGEDAWQLSVPLTYGANDITLRAVDFQRQPIATETISVESTLPDRPLQQFLRIGEIMFNPADPVGEGPESAFADNDDFEYVELVNTSDTVDLDISGVSFSGGIRFTFPAGTGLAPGERILAVRNLAAFEARYGAGMNVAGEYREPGGGNKLDNGGETIRLDDAFGGVIQSFAYNDSVNQGWPVAADGSGSSLEVVSFDDGYADPATWNDYANSAFWYANPQENGSPGAAAASAVLGRYVFYDGSALDDGAGGAVATDKTPLSPGETATLDNVTNYSGGINGIIVDLAHAPDAAALTLGDLDLSVGNDNDPIGWADAAPATLEVLPGGGHGGSDRLVITWPTDAPANTWLEVAIPGGGTHQTTTTGLATADVFYFGNAVGNTGNETLGAGLPTPPLVNASDVIAIRDNPHGLADPAGVANPYDVDRDGRVDATDLILARNNATGPLSALRWIAPSILPSAPPNSAAAEGRIFEPEGESESSAAVAKSADTGASFLESLDRLMNVDADQPTLDTQLPSPVLTKLLHRLHFVGS